MHRPGDTYGTGGGKRSKEDREREKRDKQKQRVSLKQRHDTFLFLDRARELIYLLMEHGGLFEGTNEQATTELVDRYGSVWRKQSTREPNVALLKDTRRWMQDKALDPTVQEMLGGFTVGYGHSLGGIALVDETGEMPYPVKVHVMYGDMQRQKVIVTTNRRRENIYHSAAKGAIAHGDVDGGLLLSSMGNEIALQGFVSAALVAEFEKWADRQNLDLRQQDGT